MPHIFCQHAFSDHTFVKVCYVHNPTSEKGDQECCMMKFVCAALLRPKLSSCRKKLHLALRELLKKEYDCSFFLSALREIVSAFMLFNATSTPPFVGESLQDVRSQNRILCSEHLVLEAS